MALTPYQILPGGIVAIPLTRGHTAIIDIADLPLVMQTRWYAVVTKHGVYAATGSGSAMQYMHRVLMAAASGQEVDHRNRNGLDNRRSNMRLATSSQQKCNQRVRRDSKVGLRGVQFHAETGKYRARIKINGKTVSLGLFATPTEAAQAYDDAAVRFHGEFAAPNFPVLQ